MSQSRRRWRLITAAALSMAVVAACGADDTSGEATTSQPVVAFEFGGRATAALGSGWTIEGTSLPLGLVPTGAQDDLTAAARIRRAAVERFARQGFEATILRDIATDASVTHGLVRHQFGDKAGLRRATDDDVMQRLRPAFDTPTDAPSEAVLDYRRRELLRLVASDSVALDYLARSLAEGSDPGTVLFARVAEGFHHHLTAMEAAGTLRPSPDPAVRPGLVIVIALGAWVVRPLLEDAFDVSLLDPDGLQRWLSGGEDLFRHGILRPPPEGAPA